MLRKAVNVVSYVGSAAAACLVLMTGVDVVARYAFNKPVRGGVDLTEIMLVVIVACGIAITTAEDTHIRVDSIFEKLSPFGKHILLVFAAIVSVLVFGTSVWQGAVGAMKAISDSEVTGILEIPLFPFKSFLALGFLMSLVVSIDRVVRLLSSRQR